MPSLEGIVVLDFSRILAGPYCTMLLGDLGARVIKIEQPNKGDDTRHWGPPFVGDDASYFHAVNRNKQSVTLDLKHASAAPVVDRLLSVADVLVHNFPSEVAQRLGLSYEAVRSRHPRLIYCALEAYSAKNMANRRGYDAVIQAESGLMSLTGHEKPTKMGIAIVDVLTGLFASSAILAALHQRTQSGEGQRVAVSLYDSALAALINQGQAFLATGSPPALLGNAHPQIVPYQTFATSDGLLMVAVGNDRQFERFSVALGQNWHEDARFATNRARVEARGELVPRIATALAAQPTKHWERQFESADVPAGAVRTLSDTLNPAALDQHDMRQLFEQRPDVATVASPIRPRRTDVTPPPTLGQHTRSVLQEVLELSPEEIARLQADGVF